MSVSPAPPPRAAVVTWTLLIGALVALLVFAATYGRHRQNVELRHVLFANSALPANQLAACLKLRMPLTGHWQPVADVPGRTEAWNTARGMRIALLDSDKGRRIEIDAPGGRPLRAQEAEALRTCLAGG